MMMMMMMTMIVMMNSMLFPWFSDFLSVEDLFVEDDTLASKTISEGYQPGIQFYRIACVAAEARCGHQLVRLSRLDLSTSCRP